MLRRSEGRTTYRATRVVDGAQVAVKRLELAGARSQKELELFEREREVLGRLALPEVPRVIEGFTRASGHRHALFTVRVWVEGESLAERPEDPIDAAAELLDLLAVLHAYRPAIVHRDITASNVLRRVDGGLSLIDFGSAKVSVIAAGSTIAGTFGAMAPEQLRGRAEPASDVYAVGMLVLSALSGREPSALAGPSYRPEVGRWVQRRPLRRVLSRMLEREPSKRPTASEAARALRRIRRAPTRHRAWVVALLAAVPLAVALGAAGAGAWLSAPRQEAYAAGSKEHETPTPERSTAAALPSPPEPRDRAALVPAACARTGTCRSVDHGFLGFEETSRCGGTRTHAQGRWTARLAGERFMCGETSLDEACRVLCVSLGAGGASTLTRARAVAQFIADSYGNPRPVDPVFDTWRRSQPQVNWTWGTEMSGALPPLSLHMQEGRREISLHYIVPARNPS